MRVQLYIAEGLASKLAPRLGPLNEIDLMVNTECEPDVAQLSGAWRSAPETKRTDFYKYPFQ